MPVDHPPASTAPRGARPWQRLLLHSPAARIVIYVLVFVALVPVFGALIRLTFGAESLRPVMDTPAGVVRYLAGFVLPAALAYLFLVRVVERRQAVELAWRALPRGIVLGAAGGLALMSGVVGVLWLAGSYHVSGINAGPHWVVALLGIGLGAAISEEILLRGVLFRIVEEGLGTWAALAISALFFGFAHGGNPNATPWSSIAIAIEAGVLFGLVYHVTRSLWPCIGLHAAWNFAQGSIYGIPVSGNQADGWLVSARTGPDWLSGGAFGAEASVVAIALCSACSLALLAVAVRHHSLLPPAWRRIHAPAPAGALR